MEISTRRLRQLLVLSSHPSKSLHNERRERLSLVALKSDGALVADEAEIVGPQGDEPIVDLFLGRGRPSVSMLKGAFFAGQLRA